MRIYLEGCFSESRFATMTVSLENEQWQLKASLKYMADKAKSLEKFIQKAK